MNKFDYLIKMVPVQKAQGGAETIEDMIAGALNEHHEFHYVIIGLN